MSFVIYDRDAIMGEMYFVDMTGPAHRPRFSIKLSKAQRFPDARLAYEFAGRNPVMLNCHVGYR